MYTSSQKNQVKRRIDFYTEQASELIQIVSDLDLARQVVRPYSQADVDYYLDMERYLQSKFDYVLPNALSYIPGRA